MRNLPALLHILNRRSVFWAFLWFVLGTLAACSGGGGGGGGTSGVVTPPPAAAADSYSTGTGQATLSVSSPGVLTNDTGTGLTAEKVSGPVHAASFTLNADGSFTYVHDNTSAGTTDSFTYRATNSGGTSTATVSITITPPVAVADTYGIAVPGRTLNAPGIGVLANDTPTAGLTAELLSAPAHYSSFTLNPNGSFTYVHDGSTATTDSFTYRAKVGSIVSNTATVTININQPPVASNFCSATPAGQTLSVSLSGHVTDPNAGDTVTCKLGSTTPLKGQVSDAGGVCTYMPRVNLPSGDGKARGMDKFSIRAVDSQGVQSNEIIVTVLIDGKVRIMPVGDSITQGTTVGVYNLPPPGEMISFRKKLYVDLTAGGYPIDFVGTQSEGFGGNPPVWPNGDYDHEGHPGWRDDEIANGADPGKQDPACPTCNITDWLNSKQPDIVLLHIGTNGVIDPGGTSATDVQTILNKIDTWETANGSPITVFLARIIGSPDSTRNTDTTIYNNNVASMAQIRINNGDKIVEVDQQNGAGLNYSTDMGDNLHPNQGGYDKMADKWKYDMLSSGVLPNCP